jgi:hypothetical protein
MNKISNIKINNTDNEAQQTESIKAGSLSWTEVKIWIVIVVIQIIFSAIIENFIWTIIMATV